MLAPCGVCQSADDGERVTVATDWIGIRINREEGGRLLLAGERSVAVAHEVLISQWPWLRTEGQKFGRDPGDRPRLRRAFS
jgi:hypothetical protein